jgi:hypothetical protein
MSFYSVEVRSSSYTISVCGDNPNKFHNKNKVQMPKILTLCVAAGKNYNVLQNFEICL